MLREAHVRVRAAGACSGASWLGGFWPPQGAVAGVPAGFVIQVTVNRQFYGHCSHPCTHVLSHLCT